MRSLFFSIPAYEDMAATLASMSNGENGLVERVEFPDSEIGLRLVTPVTGRNIVLVGGTYNDRATLEMYDLSCAIAKYGAKTLTLLVPYFGCSTMERATKPGMVVTAKTRARLLSSIPQSHDGNRILLLDLHADGIPHYFEGNITATHVYAKPLIHEVVQKFVDTDIQVVLASTDAGRAKWVESLANDLGIKAAFIIKNRLSGSSTKVMAVSGDVKGQHVVLYDDMIRSGGSLIEAAKAYRDAGAEKLSIVATHGVFSPTAVSRLAQSELFGAIFVTDSHPNAMKASSEFVSVIKVAKLFLPYLKVS